MKRISILLVGLLFSCQLIFAQGIDEYTGGYKIKFNEDGSKYMRVIAWGQFWAQYNDNVPDDVSKTNFSVRRARFLTYTQLNKKFLILTHFGLNSLNGGNTSPVGFGENSQLFFHDFWGEWNIVKDVSAGFGLHYWNGISRANNQSTLNMMTLDNNRQSWATIGLSDQFARHIGVYLKGKFGRLQYRVAINEANTNTLDNDNTPRAVGSVAVYRGREVFGSADAGKVFQGYFDYNFLDEESNFLPYKVGTYLGSKEVFNVGAGFFAHPDGVVEADGSAADVSIFAVDAFYDTPLGGNNDAITAYAVYQNNDYGENFELGPYATGGMFYAHVGYLIPGDKTNTRFQPYVSYNNRQIDAIDDTATRLGIGTNIFLTGHHSKFSLEYSNTKRGSGDSQGVLTLQAMIFL
ncbi:MAG: hypothetical protein HKP48_04995 [Winogradskyella sp.]|uniref:hypothetical protein n=1 Tax=Winogradskyella sp. TaxID=1883156 RepID=UPI00179B4C4A|nr:hypothetical protein [Winogradskyella sp.]MBT8246121.1 hypothetical protein [Winogradskyella sp.]NNK22656.1 hypothetical protein [Winogradskyella sp.]